MKKHVVVAPVGDNMEALLTGIEDFPTERVVLLTPEEYLQEAEQAKKKLKNFGIPTQIILLKGDAWEGVFTKMGELRESFDEKKLLVNTATGDRTTTCAATSAAFVNGLKAFSVENNQAMLLPVLKFSYYNLLSDKKLKILQLLAKDKKCCGSLEELGRKTSMSLPLISYHINGNLKSEGLKELGLVETRENSGRVAVSLTMLGRLLMKRYVS